MLIDTHCHLDATELDRDRDAVLAASQEKGVTAIVVPAIARNNFDAVVQLSQQYPQCVYAFGIHPLFVDGAKPEDISSLRSYVENNTPVAIGEIGLDYFVTKENIETQTYYFTEQLKVAKDFDLPVLLHSRRSVDDVLKYLRRFKLKGGIAHAFNGSLQQAELFIQLGFKLGFGGAMTYDRALRIRELATKLPLDAIVLETDSPDIPPEWLGHHGRNTPLELPKIAQVLADLRGENIAQVVDITSSNAIKVMPKLADLCTRPKALH